MSARIDLKRILTFLLVGGESPPFAPGLIWFLNKPVSAIRLGWGITFDISGVLGRRHHEIRKVMNLVVDLADKCDICRFEVIAGTLVMD